MAKLDFSRDYGTIMGDLSGRRFAQDGKHFDAHGNEVPDANAPAVPVKAEKPAKVVSAKPAVDDQLAAQARV